ncbi:EAL domain-containing protein [Anaerobacillus alkaliphilus]|uniref:EAL domain-containing protein n=1 Tax=Anaerobacillus alkaliphilus TaxID=1548597 RepID=A0A4Q0VTI7_9BACI|nr:EAL domain-containing protein [Anaerobacillus alkaliphilus]RXJ00285.1 EAL domain-containing protein [Anaerobacillus alkaliphilus]
MNIKSIRSQMLIYFIVALLALFGFLIYVVDKELQKLPEHMMLQYQEIANARADEIDKELHSFIQEVKMVSQSPVVQSMDLDVIKDYLPKLVLDGQHRNMTIAKTDGEGWTTLGNSIDISDQEQFQKIIVEGNPSWISQPFISPYADTDIPIIIISHEVKRNEEIVGLVNIVISNEFLNKVVQNINLGNTGLAWIVDREGNIVAHADSSVGFNRHISEFIPNNHTYTEAFNPGNGLGWLQHNNVQGKEIVTFYKSMDSSPGWTLLLSINNEELLKEVSNARVSIILFFILGIVLMSIFAFYYTTTISKPILHLKKVFEKAETGNLNVVADETVKNEVGAAAKSFNKMLTQLRKLTYRDSLTNLHNLNGFLLELPDRAKQLKKKYSNIAIVVVSLDDFKRINSISGYTGGNLVLLKLAKLLSEFVKEEEGLGRYFGDEFILLLKGDSLEKIEERIQLLWDKCSTEMTINDTEYRLRVSIGVAITDNPLIKVEDIVNEANIAKVQAKKQGGNRYQFFDQNIDRAIKIEQKVENALFHAIEKNELYLVFQPIVDLKTNTIIGTEALIRWDHDYFKQITPLKLIEIAEQSGLIVDIGKWVLREALKQNKKWHDLGYSSMFVSVNISAIQFDQPNFVSMVKSILEETSMSPEFLELEVTETNAMTMVDEKLAKMSKLKEMGIRIAIDDFGTGYSSLAYFTRFPINTLKIDRSFVNEIYHDENAKTIITTIINMAKTINIATTAEGVETFDQVKFLEEQGCDKIQGFLISRPVNPEDIEELFKNKELSKRIEA